MVWLCVTRALLCVMYQLKVMLVYSSATFMMRTSVWLAPACNLMADTQDQISGSGSGFNPTCTATLLNYLLSNSSYMEMYHIKSGVRCSASSSNTEHTIECNYCCCYTCKQTAAFAWRLPAYLNDEVSYQLTGTWVSTAYNTQETTMALVSQTDGINMSLLDLCEMDASCVCEALSGPPYHCFWNPNSLLTGEYCPRCNPLCRSVDYSLTFGQFLVGLIFLVFSYQIGHTTLTLVVSDALGSTSQVKFKIRLCSDRNVFIVCAVHYG